MMGYLGREDKTREDIDDDGYMHSGDIGALDSEGFLKITGMHQYAPLYGIPKIESYINFHAMIAGRKKELIITAGGENVAPVPIEDTIKSALPCISNVILIGDKKKFLTVFLTFKG